jgi:acyl-CoA synthetase (AMP-forming)/AMP-acid ligase II
LRLGLLLASRWCIINHLLVAPRSLSGGHPTHDRGVAGVQWPALPGQVVKAFVVLREVERTSNEELIALCRWRLGEYAVPWNIEFRAELLHSFVGKVLRRLWMEENLGVRSGIAACQT